MNTDYKLNGSLQGAVVRASTSLMLALSTFKHADRVINVALEKASQSKRFIIVYGRNINPGLYFMESGVGLYPDLKEQCEKELLADYERRWKEKTEAIAEKARTQGIQAITYVRAGCFISLCLEVIEKENPSLIITARSHRPDWFRRLFGSVADRLASQTGCTVIEAG